MTPERRSRRDFAVTLAGPHVADNQFRVDSFQALTVLIEQIDERSLAELTASAERIPGLAREIIAATRSSERDSDREVRSLEHAIALIGRDRLLDVCEQMLDDRALGRFDETAAAPASRRSA
ncbi:MAG: hypothetical protein KDA80_15660 [Planctomycetaceae bacterium]|nr:hypothetical protein [Planctomycetaceae bacterium]